jgi:hypothetical protein
MLLRRATKSSDHMDFAHHFRDLLIALEATRNTATLVTENVAASSAGNLSSPPPAVPSVFFDPKVL